MDATLLIADHNRRRRSQIRDFFCASGFLVGTAASVRDCLDELVVMKPEVLVIAADVPGGAHLIVARLKCGLLPDVRPIVLVIGSAPAVTLSALSGVAVSNCFECPVCAEDLLDRAGMEFALQELRKTEKGVDRSPGYLPRVFV